MTSPQQRKGDRFAREIKAYLKDAGLDIVRQHDGGTLDSGDFILTPFVIEAKAYRDMTTALRLGSQEAERAAEQFPRHIPACLIDRPGYGIGSSYFVIQLRHVPKLMRLILIRP